MITRLLRGRFPSMGNRPRYYSQDGEDRIMHRKYFRRVSNGVFCELGAIDGVKFSNTRFFEEHLGWTGFLVEPNPYEFSKLEANRPNSTSFNYAVAMEEGEVEMLINPERNAVGIIPTADTPKAHLDRFHPDRNYVTVKTMPFRRFLTVDMCPRIDFFSIDVEGFELEVLETFDWRIRVDYLLIEFLDSFNRDKADRARALLQREGFRYVESVGLPRNELWSAVQA